MPAHFPSQRAVVLGFGGAVATSQPLAAQAGLRMLLQGGNAADAAIAAAAVLNVVEPMSTGLGGDAFALVYWAKERQVYALNASGRAPYAATLDEFQRRGLHAMPERGMLPVTAPGTAAGWADLLARFGRLGLDTVLGPAIAYAEQGYPLSALIAQTWQAHEELLRGDPGAAHAFLPGGRAPRWGERVTLPDLGRSLRLLAEQGPDAIYRGPVARAILATSQAHGGLFTEQDLADHASTWVQPIHTDYRGYRVWECPPNGHGIAALIALNILSGYDLAGRDLTSPECVHLKMEAMKLAMNDAARYVADPQQAEVPVAGLLSPEYTAARRALISSEQAIHTPTAGQPPAGHDTVYLCAADSEGNAVSFINSLYMSFGSGLVAEGTGIILQNRGNLFALDPQHPNCIAPHKRPYHTIIPCMVTQGDRLAICYGVMGGFMQPQGHMQVLTNIVDHGLDAQQALDAPRFMYARGDQFTLEQGWEASTVEALRRKGHQISHGGYGLGGGQVIMLHPESGALLAGSDPRKDGCAVAF